LALCGLTTGGNVVYGYDDDTHLALTYYLAIKVGYTPDEARMIANANIRVDYDKKTSPLNYFDLKVRGDHHAFVDNAGFLDASMNKKLAEGYLKARKDELREEAVKKGNPGSLLHFVQDSYSHEGYGNLLGQIWNRNWNQILHPDFITNLVLGKMLFLDMHYPDFIDADRSRAAKMANESVSELQKFMRDYLGREPTNVDPTELAAVLEELSKVNRARTDGSPDYAKAKDVIEKALGSRAAPTLEDARTQTKRFGYDESLSKTPAAPTVRIVFDDNAPKRTSTPVVTPRRAPTPTPTPRVSLPPIRPYTPAPTPTPSVTYRSPPTTYVAPTVPFPTAISAMPFPVVPMPAASPINGGGGRRNYGFGYDDSLPKTRAPGGVSMRVNINPGTFDRAPAPSSLLSKIRDAR